jgi:hypothetical protein
VGDAIDSLQGSCRRIQASPPESLIENSMASQLPFDVGIGGTNGIRFTVPSGAVGLTLRFGVAARIKPDLRSGTLSSTAPVSFRVDILDPTGQTTLGTATFRDAPANSPRYVSARVAVADVHFLRVVNLTAGQTLQVTSVDVTR